MSDIKNDEERQKTKTGKFVTYVFIDEESEDIKTVTQPVYEKDNEYDQAANYRFFLNLFTGDNFNDTLRDAQNWIRNYQENKPIDFDKVRYHDNRRMENGKKSYCQYEDGSVVLIVPEEEFQNY